jgi:hypothetical protein
MAVLDVPAGQDALRRLRRGPDGVAWWNALPAGQRRDAGPFDGADLRSADLAGANLSALDFSGACFDGANLAQAFLLETVLERASLWGANLERAWCVAANFQQARFQDAVLRRANLRECDCRGATFAGANLAGATLDGANLCGADLSRAELKGASVRQARYDEETRFPETFRPGEALEWVGAGPPPVAFDVFLQSLRDNVDAGRLGRALEMLRAESFQLYSRGDADAVVGVVKSQTDEGVVYSCRLDSAGGYSCCNQKLQQCLGLRTDHGVGRGPRYTLCKHLLVLIVGLTRARQADGRAVAGWVRASRTQAPGLDEDVLAEPLLRYTAAQAGQIDWRPTETIPEDYYAL